MNDDWATIRARRVLEKLTAENERLREHVGASGIAYAEALRKRAEQAEARTRALEAALKSARYRFMLMRVAEVLPGEEATFCRYVQAEAKYGTEGADAALTEPPPPQEEPR